MSEITDAQYAAAVADAVLRDVTLVVDSDRRLLEFALSKAKDAGRADTVGRAVLHTLAGMLSPGQQTDALGALLEAVLAHVSETDLGSYYLRKYDDIAAAEAANNKSERLIDSGQWAIIATLHDAECARCRDAAESAAIHAAVTGSVGATYGIERRASADGEVSVEHEATVRRKRDADDA